MEGVGVGVAVRGCVETNALCEMDWSDGEDGIVYNHVTHKLPSFIVISPGPICYVLWQLHHCFAFQFQTPANDLSSVHPGQ